MRPSRAMVFAAGLGTRMRPLTNDRPKALVEVAGKALIDWGLERLAGAGVSTAVVNVHHFPERLEGHLAARTAAPTIIVSDERDVLLETGGGLVRALPLLGDAPLFTLNADTIWRETGGSALGALADAFDPDRMDAILLLAPRVGSIGYDGAGDFTRDGAGRLARRGDAPGAPWVYAGAQVIHPRVVQGLKEERFSLNRIWDGLLPQGRLFGLPLDGLWLHVGDPAARDDAEAALLA
jgi:N-acetyl-alpha-D-muramate 1-phosphate uridylyltransferase